MIQTLHPVTGLALASGKRPWLFVLAVMAAAGLLLAFQQVVSQGTLQSAARQRSTAAVAEASWRCNAPGPASQRAACRATLDAAR